MTKKIIRADAEIKSKGKIVADLDGAPTVRLRVTKYVVRACNRRVPLMNFMDSGESVGKNLMKRMMKVDSGAEVKAYRSMIDAVAKELGLAAPNGKLSASWSAKAGCSCGCSPAFIMKSLAEYYPHLEFFVDYVIEKK